MYTLIRAAIFVPFILIIAALNVLFALVAIPFVYIETALRARAARKELAHRLYMAEYRDAAIQRAQQACKDNYQQVS